METLAAPGGGLPLAASVADVAALVAELIAVFAVSVAELAFSEADLSLEQPVRPPITIAVHPTATTNARSTTLSPLCCIRCFGKPIHLPLSVLGTPVKVGVRCRFGCWPCRHPCVVAVGPWSEGQGGAPAAQQGRTTLTPARIPPHTPGRVGQGEKCCDSSHEAPPVTPEEKFA